MNQSDYFIILQDFAQILFGKSKFVMSDEEKQICSKLRQLKLGRWRHNNAGDTIFEEPIEEGEDDGP